MAHLFFKKKRGTSEMSTMGHRTAREKVYFEKKMRTHSKKSPQIYLSVSEADTKAKVCKKSKILKCIQ